MERSADLRYEHQSFELTCPLGEGALTPARLRDLVQTFHREHRRLYTYDIPSATVELVNLRVTAIGRLPERAAPTSSRSGGDATSARTGDKSVHFMGRGFVACAVYARNRLAPGMTLAGPAIVDQPDTTVLIAPGFRARVDESLSMILERR